MVGRLRPESPASQAERANRADAAVALHSLARGSWKGGVRNPVVFPSALLLRPANGPSRRFRLASAPPPMPAAPSVPELTGFAEHLDHHRWNAWCRGGRVGDADGLVVGATLQPSDGRSMVGPPLIMSGVASDRCLFARRRSVSASSSQRRWSSAPTRSGKELGCQPAPDGGTAPGRGPPALQIQNQAVCRPPGMWAQSERATNPPIVAEALSTTDTWEATFRRVGQGLRKTRY